MRVLREIVDNPETPGGRWFAWSIQIIIFVTLFSFAVGTLPNLSPTVRHILRWEEIITVGIFTLEYLLRVSVARKKLNYIFSFFGLIDLMSILPFYLNAGIDLRPLRMYRLMRIFQILKLVRYNKAIHRFHRAFLISKEEITLFFSLTGFLLFVAAVGTYYFEREAQPDKFSSVFHSLWWAVITLTTVGYGDVYPVTLGGRAFTVIVLMIGIGIVAVPAAIVTSALSEARLRELSEEEKKDRSESRSPNEPDETA
jgi:voltage-gated potassium channel